MSNQEIIMAEQVAEEPETIETAAAESPSHSAEVKATAAQLEVSESEETATQASSTKGSTLPVDTEDGDASESLSIHTLKRGQKLKGKVKNITSFGAFVDIGLPQDGLVHISELARKKVGKVTDIVSEGQEVDVWIKKIDTKRGRISLTMIKPISLRLRDIAQDSELEGKVTRLESFGAFVDIGSERDGLVHISQITHDYIKDLEEALTIGDTVKVKVLKVNRKKRQVDLSIKALLPPPQEVQKVETVETVEVVAEVQSEEPAPTAMALAYAAMQNKGSGSDSSGDSDFAEGRHKRKKELDEIINRTLATSE
jgi:predicted RNA-binding protein with RPS1 domain